MPERTRSRLRRIGALALVALVATALVPAGAVGTAAASSHPQEAFVVDLHEDGSATVTLRLTFDLTTEGERTAFRELRDNETAKRQLRDQFAERLGAVAASTANETGREMTVAEPNATVRSTGDTGVVALAVTWTNLAAVDGDRLVLERPFAGDFDPGRPFVVHAPDGYAVTAEPSPDTSSDATVRWSADTSLDGFSVVATPGGSTDTLGQPGFTAVGAVAALVGAALLLRRR